MLEQCHPERVEGCARHLRAAMLAPCHTECVQLMLEQCHPERVEGCAGYECLVFGVLFVSAAICA